MRRGFKVTESSLTNKNKTKSFTQYLTMVSNIKMFESAQQEAECAYRILEGDEKAMEEMVLRNLRFVISVANKYECKSASVEDLVNQGNIGLMEAAMKFDPSKGFRFISFAVWYIRKEMMAYLSNRSRVIRLPVNKVNSLGKFYEKVDLLTQKLDRRPEDFELYGNLDDFTDKQIDDILSGQAIKTSSIDKPVDLDDARGETMIDFISSPDGDKFEVNTMRETRNLLINEMLDNLKPNERDIIIHHFGLQGEEEKTLVVIAEKMNMTREGARLCLFRGLKKLKLIAEQNQLQEELFF